MSNKRKKIIVSTRANSVEQSKSGSRSSSNTSSTGKLLFDKENYKWMIIGVVMIIVGMLLMIGGFNENPNVWDESAIYGFQRTVLAPFIILAGLVVNVYAIFKSSKDKVNA